MSSLFARRIVAYGADCLLLFAVLAPLGGAVQWALGVVPTDALALYGTLLLSFRFRRGRTLCGATGPAAALPGVHVGDERIGG